MKLSNTKVFSTSFIYTDAYFEYYVLPHDKLTPYFSFGSGILSSYNINDISFKMQYGLGVEYLANKKLGFRLYADKNHLFTDKIDNKIYGNDNDAYWTFGVGMNLFLGK